MKKLSIILGIALISAVTLFSCKDESGIYVEQLYTNAQKELAIKECLRTSADSAVSHLCVDDGFYSYHDMDYRIDYDLLQASLFDTLENHGYGYLSDTLILRTNRLAESCGGQVLSALKTAIDSLTISAGEISAAIISYPRRAISQLSVPVPQQRSSRRRNSPPQRANSAS